MALYHNHTHRNAIVTIMITSIVDTKKAFEIGLDSSPKTVSAEPGVHDFVVGPEQTLKALEGVEATFLSARSDS